MSILKNILVYLLLGIFPVAQAVQAQPEESPVEMLERTSNQVIEILRNDMDELKKNPDKVYRIVDEYILPHLDDVTMAKLALGKNWKKATREQKLEFVESFRNLLIRTYSKSLLEFSDQEIRYFPVKVPPDAKKISVKAEVIQPGGPPVPLAYRMRVKNNMWKVYDIKVDGVSLVTSYRGTFTQEIRKSGIEGLLEYLREKNQQLASDKT
ncbi:MAG TPA: ABC transporter substrate-binding protein [Gammaproteobacteria bacterium]|nr:ABC transporter substrate-binding protein [Gammaproteobacteria bacterium]